MTYTWQTVVNSEADPRLSDGRQRDRSLCRHSRTVRESFRDTAYRLTRLLNQRVFVIDTALRRGGGGQRPLPNQIMAMTMQQRQISIGVVSAVAVSDE